MKTPITLILGTTRLNSESSKVAGYIHQLLQKNDSLRPEYLDLGQADIPLFEERLTHLESPTEDLVKWNETLKTSAGILIVAPEYKNAYPGSLKNFLDYLPPQIFKHKPVGIVSVSSGASGGQNCLAQLRLVVLAMGGVAIPEHLRVAHVKEVFPQDGSGPDDNFQSISINFLEEYLYYVRIFAERDSD
jgi:NAD(P)H-dependent FMN reductase